MASKPEANRYILSEAAMEQLLRKAVPHFKAKEKEYADYLVNSLKKFFDKKTSGHTLSDPDLKAAIIKEVGKYKVANLEDFLKALNNITRMVDRVAGSSKSYTNAMDKQISKATLSSSQALQKSMGELVNELKVLRKDLKDTSNKNENNIKKIIYKLKSSL